ncbi:MAG: tRNA pseudouridine(55) synthase TruB [Verrucomicrobia bacterium]|nr:MAG: tRNA pseudouridine(55) synthase TruB [Verrucomicrobiota bacterium]
MIRAALPEFDGVLLIDKPSEHTSHDVVARVRGILRMRRVGHAGTLDPMATGLLVVLLGKTTKLSQYLMSVDKTYTGSVTLGKITNTQDAEGEVLETRPVPTLTEDTVKATLRSMVGDQYQIPPMFSAIKIHGQPLYKAARAGEEIEREPRFIRVKRFELTRWAPPDLLDFSVDCTKGTYVRTLAHDLGQKLGCGAHLSALRRISSGALNVSRAVTLEALQKMGPAEVQAALIPGYEAAPSSAIG